MNALEPLWKILIADDEYIIREGIRAAVAWAELNMEVVAEAEDGEEALELALKHQVNIILLDLNMPIMNGLTLMEHLREQHPSCRIVIITGHDEFVYAQQAIRVECGRLYSKASESGAINQNIRKNCQGFSPTKS